ncbi:type II toxin-antitoxin system VapC family toxin [Occultella glacieicola]|uniref:type II toxin-antitoxin system VapC family toxin n=1 Tax=Occultella glacieicola TaxID=2518684 RepID=UPI001F3692DE|nr:type II toxin-antitoxin system VapC family toxin [Occultella glacieicola]
MTFLLDTHALLWALTDPERLGPESSRIISARSSRLIASAASAWEISTKQRLGRLPHADALVGAYPRHLDRLGVVRLPISEEHALLAGGLEWAHRDPFDRLLAAQAMIESLTLLTKDPAFTGLPGLATTW